ncbi:LuxR C-terminal-related transcriptional regulator [Bacteroidota bacterium]
MQGLPFDPDLDQYRDRLFRSREVERLLILGSQFLYIYDFSSAELVYVSESVRDVIGYEPMKMTLKTLFDIVHPSDRIKVIQATQKSIELIKESGQTTPCEVSAHVNYRLRKACGTYISVLQQNAIFKTDKQDNILYSLGIISDITYLKPGRKVELNVMGLKQEPDLEKGIEIGISDEIFSHREIEIINLIAEGNKSAEIAEKLSISPHTVLTHRKNMLKRQN